MTTDIKWYDQVDNSQAKPHQWYFHGEPCDILAIGVIKGEKKPAVHRLKTAAGETLEIWWKDGTLPGVTYEVFEHAPGRA